MAEKPKFLDPKNSIKYPNDILSNNSKYGNMYCLITILDTYNEAADKPNEEIKNTNGESTENAYNAYTGKLSIRNSLNVNIRNVAQNIILPMPMNLSIGYGMSYKDVSLNELGMKLASSAVGSAADIGIQLATARAAKAGGKKAGKALNKTLEGLKSGIGKAVDVGGTAVEIGSIITGTALNPHQELVFDKVNFRKFKLKYKLIAKNLPETGAIKALINDIEYHMHPSLHAGTLLFKYPSEFEIRFVINSATKESPYMFRLYRCILENLTINYGGNGNLALFKKSDGSSYGAPVEIEIDMDFKETNIMTKELIQTIRTDEKTRLT